MNEMPLYLHWCMNLCYIICHDNVLMFVAMFLEADDVLGITFSLSIEHSLGAVCVIFLMCAQH